MRTNYAKFLMDYRCLFTRGYVTGMRVGAWPGRYPPTYSYLGVRSTRQPTLVLFENSPEARKGVFCLEKFKRIISRSVSKRTLQCSPKEEVERLYRQRAASSFKEKRNQISHLIPIKRSNIHLPYGRGCSKTSGCFSASVKISSPKSEFAHPNHGLVNR